MNIVNQREQSARRILAIYAHPDDAEIWAGGTLLAHRDAGDHTAVCVLTHGDSHRAPEAQRGADLLGARLHQLTLRDRALRTDESAIAAVAAVLQAERPQIVLTHWMGDCHPDHLATWEITRSAILLAKSEDDLQALFWSDTYNGSGLHGVFEPDCLVDVSSVWERKMAAISAHQSQNPPHYLDMTAFQCALHGARGGVTHAEGFRRVPFFGKGRRASASLWAHV